MLESIGRKVVAVLLAGVVTAAMAGGVPPAQATPDQQEAPRADTEQQAPHK